MTFSRLAVLVRKISSVNLYDKVIKMSLINNRYFKNELDDYKSGAVKIDEGVIKHQIQNIVEDILIQQPANYRNCRGGK